MQLLDNVGYAEQGIKSQRPKVASDILPHPCKQVKVSTMPWVLTWAAFSGLSMLPISYFVHSPLPFLAHAIKVTNSIRAHYITLNVQRIKPQCSYFLGVFLSFLRKEILKNIYLSI